MYINSAFNPTDDMTGGVWYGNALEWDQALVDSLAQAALQTVQEAVSPHAFERANGRRFLIRSTDTQWIPVVR